jgi:hypothetical protein
MATKRRRSTTAAKRRTTARRKTATPRVHASNPHHHTRSRNAAVRHRRHVSRRRNPSTGGLVTQAAGLAAGITAVGLIGSFVPPIGGNSPFAIAGRQAATGWLIGEGMQRFNVMRNYANDMKLAGVALGIGTLINAFILPTVSGFLRPAPKAQAQNTGMQGIAVVPSFPPQLTPVAASPAGVNGIAVSAVPGGYRRQW